MRKGIEDLPIKIREVFTLYTDEDLSYREIAQRLDISYDIVRKRISQGRAILKQRLAEYDSDYAIPEPKPIAPPIEPNASNTTPTPPLVSTTPTPPLVRGETGGDQQAIALEPVITEESIVPEPEVKLKFSSWILVLNNFLSNKSPILTRFAPLKQEHLGQFDHFILLRWRSPPCLANL